MVFLLLLLLLLLLRNLPVRASGIGVFLCVLQVRGPITIIELIDLLRK
jgi:hypothetical protein